MNQTVKSLFLGTSLSGLKLATILTKMSTSSTIFTGALNVMLKPLCIYILCMGNNIYKYEHKEDGTLIYKEKYE